MNYLSATNLSKYYGERLLFNDLTFYIDKGQKVALIARNGSGKSTLINIIRGVEPPETGEVKLHKNIKVGVLIQDPIFDSNKTVFETILNSNNPKLRACLDYENALNGFGNMEDAMHKMDELHAWDYELRIKQILSKFLIHDLNQKIGVFSGGQIKRLALAILLIQEPDFLILDEPTNHLDLDMIEWLEAHLSQDNITLLMITHDRYFLENICSDIIELENGKLYKHKGNYSTYLQNKELREENLRVNLEKAKNIYLKELEWMRRQPKARTTKAKSREDNFEQVKQAAHQQIKQKNVEIEVKMNRLGGKILELHNVSKSYGNKIILDNFTYKFQRGERIGIVGRNGCGKSTLLNIINGLETADTGNIVVGDTIVFGYYHQKGMQLKEDKRVIEVIKAIAEYIPVAGGQLSASQLLERFLFSHEQQYNYVSTLSGGEKRRLYLLTILIQNPNFLILDEPTNDLDILTLQILEDFLLDYKGCLMIVSHDRYFLDKLTDWLFVFSGNGSITTFLGNYNEYRLEEKERNKLLKENITPVKPIDSSKQTIKEKKKLSFKEQQEFNNLEKDISILSQQKTTLTEQLSSGTLTHQQIQEIALTLEKIINSLDEKELRWLELSEYL